MRKIALAATGVLLSVGLLSPIQAFAIDDVNTSKLRKAVTVSGILQHERALQSIANKNDGTRASGTPGFDASADYVVKKLRKAGYKVKRQTSPSRSSVTWRLPHSPRSAPTPGTSRQRPSSTRAAGTSPGGLSRPTTF